MGEIKNVLGATLEVCGTAPPVFLGATHENALKYVSLNDLNKHAIDLK